MKRCKDCGEEKPLTSFYLQSGRMHRRAICKQCNSKRRKVWYKNNPEKVRVIRRRYLVKRVVSGASVACRYGMTVEQYHDFVQKHNNACAICFGKELAKKRVRLSVDHDAVSGKVRGLLCSKCNMAIGLFRHQPNLLRDAAHYLEKHV
jgi:hypothetical protein